MPKKNFHEFSRILQSTMEEALPSMTQADVAAMIAKAMRKECENLRAEITLQVNNGIANSIPPQVDSFLRNCMSNNTLHVHPTQDPVSSAQDLQYQLYLLMKDSDKLYNDDLSIWWSLKIKSDKPTPVATSCRTVVIRPRDHDDHHDDAHLEGENSAKRHKIEEHQYHVDKMHNYLKNDIIWESKKERLSLPTLQKPTPAYHSCQRNSKAPPMTLLNQDLFYLKYGNSRPKKYTLSLYKFPAVPFPDDDIEEQTSRWKEKRDKPEEVYSDSKIVELIRTSYELGHEHKFITEIILRRTNGKIDPITKPDYKYLNKNDIEDLYLLCINGKVDNYKEAGSLGSLTVFIKSTTIWERVHDLQLGMEIYQQNVNLTTSIITFPGIEREKLLTITFEPVVGMIYENSKKEKRVMIHKFCDATLKRFLEKLKKYNKDVKYRYVVPSPSDADAEYL
ncbi:hypothetical protein Tco_1575861 [Tanacetum coccineum]